MMVATRFIACAFSAFLTFGVSSQVIQLKGGHTLIGEVSEPNDDGLTLRRFDNGGTLQLRWDQLTPESAQNVKIGLGLSVDDESEVTVTADVIRYELAGGGNDEVVGKKVDENPTHIIIERLGQRWEIRRKSIRYVSSREVPVLDVFTKDRFYGDQLAEFSPGENGEKHIALADVLVRVRDYTRALEHLEKAQEFGGVRQPAALDGKIKRVKLYEAAKAEAGMLDQIKVAIARKAWGKGLALIETYEQQHEKGRLAGEFLKIKDRFAKARTRHLVRKVVEVWMRAEVNLSRKKANEYGVELGSVRDYAESEMGKEIRERVAKVLGIEAEEVDEFFKQRIEMLGSGLRSERYSYGVGSWVLGDSAITKDTKQGKAQAKQTKGGGQNRVEEQRLRRIQRAIERARRASSRSRGREKQEDSPEDWWKEATTDEKRVWLRAYYAEFGGDREVTSAHLSDCLTCGARGFLEIYQDAGKPKREPCPTCHKTSFKRWIRAR